MICFRIRTSEPSIYRLACPVLHIYYTNGIETHGYQIEIRVYVLRGIAFNETYKVLKFQEITLLPMVLCIVPMYITYALKCTLTSNAIIYAIQLEL